MPPFAAGELRDDYRYRPANALPSRLKVGLSDKQFKPYHTARRPNRSHFGSATAIRQVAFTVGAQGKRVKRACRCCRHPVT
jgi:hypothetical protein